MTVLTLAGGEAARDLATYARRVARFDGEAVVRVVARGMVAGFFAETPFDALALRSAALAAPAEADEVVEAGTLAARAAGAGEVLELPPPVAALRWTAGLPPSAGWAEVARLATSEVSDRVAEGVSEFRTRAAAGGNGAPPSRDALESLAADVWARELAGGVPIRLAHAAESYGFLGGPAAGDVVLRTVGSWQRLDAPYGSVLGRSADVLGLYVG